MPKCIFLLLFLFLIYNSASAQTDIKVTANFNGKSLKEAFDYLQNEHNISFSYNASIIKNKKAKGIFREQPFDKVFSQLLKDPD